jgi:hypothetical protein
MHGKQLTTTLSTLLGLTLLGLLVITFSGPSVRAGLHAAAPFAITAHDPATHKVGVALTANISATFDDDASPSTLTNDTFVVHGDLGGMLTGTLTYDGGSRTVTLDPGRDFYAGEELRASATADISSSGGTELSPYGWQFTAGNVYSRCVEGFTEVATTITDVNGTTAVWGDVDNDGDLDLLLAGMLPTFNHICAVYRNDGASGFTDIGAGLPLVYNGDAAWGDYDSDGDLDLLLIGTDAGSYTAVSKVYRNEGAGAFSDVSAALVGLSESAGAWGDYDNDGDLDLVLAGLDATWTRVSKVYRNDDGVFAEVSAGLTGVSSGSVAWGDAEGDGDLDILLIGYAGYPDEDITKLYRNDAAGSGFTEVAAGLPELGNGEAAWGDYDNDGDLDILLAGRDAGGSAVSLVYRNDGALAFTDANVGLVGVTNAAAAWGDYDNDGDLDILLSGVYTGTTYVSTVYRNDAAGSGFSDMSAGLAAVAATALAWGDYDSDGDLDILLTGSSAAGPTTLLYRNDDCPPIVRDHDPLMHGRGVEPAAQIRAIFDHDMDAGTATTRTFAVHGSMSGVLNGAFSYHEPSRSLTFTPERSFHAGEELRVSATSGIVSTLGLPLAPYGWQFTAGPLIPDRCVEGFHETSASFLGVYESSAAWGDYDNDGDVDLLLTGATSGVAPYSPLARVYRNEGGIISPTFTPIAAGLGALYAGSAAWGDVDNDGDLDILLSGNTSGSPLYVSKVFRYDGGWTFTEIGAGLVGVSNSSVAWGDYDNDGDLDVLLAGNAIDGYPTSRVYRNDGAYVFTDISAGLTGVQAGSVAWGDYDNDGDLDIVLTGMGWDGATTYEGKLFRNDGGDTFTALDVGLPGVQHSTVAWGDYDQDGDLDILLTGSTETELVTQVYRNDGSGMFESIGASLMPASQGTASWADYDNDGDLDIAVSGRRLYDPWTPMAKVYYQTAAHDFVDRGWELVAGVDGSIAWGDYDGDGDLDLLLTGDNSDPWTPKAPIAKLYRNMDCPVSPNVVGTDPLAHEVGVPPTATLQATFDRDIDVGTVSSATFALHGSMGGLVSGPLVYNEVDRTLTLSPSRDFYSGEVLRAVATAGMESIQAMPVNPYGWQFTPGVVRGSKFFTFTESITDLTGVQRGSVAWADYDLDGDLDLLITGNTQPNPSLVPASKLYRNDGPAASPVFSEVAAGLTGVSQSSVAWGDYDMDGDPDILLTGLRSDHSAVTELYRNDGGGSFSEVATGLTPMTIGAVAWGDYDNDGDLDILLTGDGHLVGKTTELYRNDGAGSFSVFGVALPALSRSSVAWGDYDVDGDLDMLLAGEDRDYEPATRLYRNDGGGTFTDQSTTAGLADVWGGSVSWGDYDNDASPDILLTGATASGSVSKVFRNLGDGTFSETVSLPGVVYSSAAWGDYDNDSDLDILLAGRLTPGNYMAAVYRNDGDGIFEDIAAPLTGTEFSSVAWADYDLDGDLDFVITGEDGSGSVTVLYSSDLTAVPGLGGAEPSGESGPVGVTHYFTTTWTDPDGYQHLKHCYFHIGRRAELVGNVTLLYNAAKNRLWLRSDDGLLWTGGFAPGGDNVLENSQAIVHCAETAVWGDGHELAVRWAIEFKGDATESERAASATTAGFTGYKKLGLKCKDDRKARAKGAWVGSFTVTE